MGTVRELLDRIVEDGVITKVEHDELMEAIHEDGEIDLEESEQISRMFALIQEGTVRIVDEEREESEARRRDAIRSAMLEKTESSED